MKRASFKPHLEHLEERCVPYAASGLYWSIPNISVSYLPDGTMTNGTPSALFALLDPIAPTATWQREYARALQTWADVAEINFHFVADSGLPTDTFGQQQGDSRFGDIRLGAAPLDFALAST